MKILKSHMWDKDKFEELVTDKAVIDALKEKFNLELYEDGGEFYILIKGHK